MTASERARQINEETQARATAEGWTGFCKLVEDKEHWDGYNIHTAEELDHYLAAESHWDLYKEVNGIRPRHVDYSKLTTQQIEAMNKDLIEQLKSRYEEEIEE